MKGDAAAHPRPRAIQAAGLFAAAHPVNPAARREIKRCPGLNPTATSRGSQLFSNPGRGKPERSLRYFWPVDQRRSYPPEKRRKGSRSTRWPSLPFPSLPFPSTGSQCGSTCGRVFASTRMQKWAPSLRFFERDLTFQEVGFLTLHRDEPVDVSRSFHPSSAFSSRFIGPLHLGMARFFPSPREHKCPSVYG